MKTIGERIVYARNLKKISRKELSQALGLTYCSIDRWEKNNATPRGHRIEALALALDVSIEWILVGDAAGSPEARAQHVQTPAESVQEAAITQTSEEPTFLDGSPPLFAIGQDFERWQKTVNFDACVAVKFYPNVKASAGYGAFNEEGKPPLPLFFRRYFIENTLGKNPAHLVAIMVSGDSMSPTLKSGDTMLIDISKGWQGDGIYLIRIGTDLLVKRLQKSIGHQLSIISDNSAWETKTFDLRQIDGSEFAILGKHLWHGSSAI
jgi:phage repressor protein C with HTH and peptisase S24 domain